MKKKNIAWGLFFIFLAAVYLVISSTGMELGVGLPGIFMTVLFVWLFVEGIKDVNFYLYLNDSEFVQKNPQYFAMEDQAISIDESYEVIGKMGIEKAGLLMKGKKSKKYYLVHDFIIKF